MSYNCKILKTVETQYKVGAYTEIICPDATNLALGLDSFRLLTTGIYNHGFGTRNFTDLTTGSSNTAVGYECLSNTTSGSRNVALGRASLNDNITGHENTCVGPWAGTAILGSGNICLGCRAGELETGSNKLYVDNTNTSSPLIYGDFSSTILNINGDFGIKNDSPNYTFHIQPDETNDAASICAMIEWDITLDSPASATLLSLGHTKADTSYNEKLNFDAQGNLSVYDSYYPTLLLENSSSIEGGQIQLASSSATWSIYVNTDGLRFYKGSDKVLFSGNDRVAIDVATPTAKLHIDQVDASEAIPVLLLDQADVSEEFIKFVGTAANGVLTNSIVKEADVTTATRAGFIKIFVQDEGNQITDQAYYIPIFTLV